MLPPTLLLLLTNSFKINIHNIKILKVCGVNTVHLYTVNSTENKHTCHTDFCNRPQLEIDTVVAACLGVYFGVRLELAVCLLLAGCFGFDVWLPALRAAHFETLPHVAS